MQGTHMGRRVETVQRDKATTTIIAVGEVVIAIQPVYRGDGTIRCNRQRIDVDAPAGVTVRIQSLPVVAADELTRELVRRIAEE